MIEKNKNRRGISAYFITHPVTANLLMMLLLVVGLFTAMGLRKELMPATEPNIITVSVEYISGAAAQTENAVTIKIEEALKGLSGIKKVTSISTGVDATVIITKTSKQKLEPLFSDIKTRVDAIQNLPARAEKAVITKERWEDHAIWIQLYGDADQRTLQTLGRNLRKELLRYSDITKINLHGTREPILAIEVTDQVLESYGLTLEDIAAAVGQESLIEISGELRNAEGVTKIKASWQGYNYEDYAKIMVVSKQDGRQIRLSDIATITETFDETPATLSRFQQQPTIGLELVATGSGDVIKITDKAQQVVEQWRASQKLPEGVNIASWYDQSSYIKSRLSLLFDNGLTGILLIFIVLSLTLNMRVALFVALGIPVSIAGTLMLMGESLLNLTINDLSTFGFILALGILVDDGVVIGESVYATRQAEGDNLDSTIHGVHKVAIPTIFGVLTTIAAFYPLALIEGELGQMFASFSTVVAVCLMFSLLESKLILPAHLAHVPTGNSTPTNIICRQWQRIRSVIERGITALKERIYRPLLRKAILHRYAALMIFCTFFVLIFGLVTSGTVRSVFFPDVPGRVITVTYVLPEETGYNLAFNHANTIEGNAKEINQMLMKKYQLAEPPILHLQTLVTSSTEGMILAELNEPEKLPISIDAITKLWRTKVGQLEGTRSLQFISGWVGAEDLMVELQCDDSAQLLEAGNQLRHELSTLPGVFDLKDDMNPAIPQIDLKLTDQGRAMGLTSARVASLVQQGFYGYETQTFQNGEEEVKVRVRFPKEQRQSIENLLNTRIRLDGGQAVPLSQVVELKTGMTVSSVNRQNNSRSIYISAGIDKKKLSPGEVITYLEQNVLPDLKRQYPAIHLNFGGEAEEEQETTQSMKKVFALSLLAIYMLLAIPLGSYTQPLLIMTAIPFGFVGAILGHWLCGLPLSLLSFMGMLALSGVMVNDSLLLVTRYNTFKGQGLAPLEALMQAGPDRLRAILLTSFTTYIGLVPLLKETSEQAQYLMPAATSLAYGVLFGTLITLFLLPVLIHIREDIITHAGTPRKRVNNDKAYQTHHHQ